MSREQEDGGRLLHVSQAQFWACFVAALCIFFFAVGPLWRHAGDIARLDGAIFWSYGAIPLLIGGCLLWSRRFTWRGFLLDSLALAVLKYAVTNMIAVALWATIAPPLPAAPAPRPPPPTSRPEPPPAPTPIDPAQTGVVEASVADAQGRPVEGAVVYVSAGLSGYVFAPPAKPLAIEHGPDGVRPALAVVQAGQRIEGRSTDGHMHTLVATLLGQGGAPLFNVPLLPSGVVTPVVVREAHGMTVLRCNVHPTEPTSRLLVLSHPFFARTDAEGKARLAGVPAGPLRVAATGDDWSAAEQAVALAAGAKQEVRIVLEK